MTMVASLDISEIGIFGGFPRCFWAGILISDDVYYTEISVILRVRGLSLSFVQSKPTPG
jgi:hypothetical protein